MNMAQAWLKVRSNMNMNMYLTDVKWGVEMPQHNGQALHHHHEGPLQAL